MRTTLLSAAALALTMCCNAQTNAPAITFQPLPYAYDALEPHIDAKTMEIHYSRHHKAYFTNTLKALEGTDLVGKTMEAIMPEISKRPTALRNNLGGHFNHTLFWNMMSPKGGGTPTGLLLEKINTTFGSFDAFKEAFKQAATTRFGSGWAWLCVAEDGSLFLTSTANQDNPLMDVAEKRGTPILAIDVWEHAYYLKYQNLRASYVDAFWNVVNWPYVTTLFEQAEKTNKTTPQQK
jgi:superoxide dismutase, Fe-Mn family